MNIYSSVQLKIKIFSYIRIKKSYRKNFPNSIENKKIIEIYKNLLTTLLNFDIIYIRIGGKTQKILRLYFAQRRGGLKKSFDFM